MVINADSQQVYAELPILTAQPGPQELARAPHRLYGCLSAQEPCSVGTWLRLAQMEIDWALGQGMPAIVVGGTGLYLKALLEGIAEIPAIPPEVRLQAENDLAAMGREAFHQRLQAVDPVLGIKLFPGDTQRILRAYAVWLGSGKPLSWWQSHAKKPIYNREQFELFHVKHERAELYRRIDARFIAMINNGAVQEVENLLMQHLPTTLPAMRIIGVPELSAYLRGEISLEAATARAQQATRNYAKRQLTWFNHQLPGAKTPASAIDRRG